MNTDQNHFDVNGRVIVVTGASSGIGASIARCLAANGARVVVAARRLDRLQAMADSLPDALAVVCDVSNAEDCQNLIDRAVVWGGRIDVLINNAGAYTIRPAEEDTMEDFDHVMNVNLRSVFALSTAAGRYMLKEGTGSIINIASTFGLVGSGAIKQAPYAASKGGVVNLTRELSAQWSRRGVRVNAIAPAFFDSEMTTTMWDDEATMRWLRRQTPMGRRGELNELHGPVLFLASDASSYVTGITLPVDGGWTSV